MRSELKCFAVSVIIVFAAIVLASGVALSKSLYVIADINSDPNPTPIAAYDIQGNQLVYQFTQNVPYYGWGAVGIALDANSKTLFITYEESDTIQILDATTMEDLGTVQAEDAQNLAGIVFDNDKNLLYVVDRETPKLYVYEWDAENKTLTLKDGFPIDLPNANGIYGIALDEKNDILYVANSNGWGAGGNVLYYSTADWSYLGSFEPSLGEGVPPIGIAVDYIRGYVYTVAGYAGSNVLSQYNINTGQEVTVEMEQGGIGVAVDQATGLLYMTNGNAWDDYDFISVWDPTTLTQLFTTGDLDGDPTGIVVPVTEVSYNPLNLTVTDNPDPVSVGQNLTYTICFDNANNDFPVHNVTLVDELPDAVTFVSATGGGTYDGETNSVTWNVGDLDAGAAQQCFDLVVNVRQPLTSGYRLMNPQQSYTITNSVTIDSDETPPSTVTEDTEVRISGDLPDLSNVRVFGPRVWVKGMRSVVLVRYRNTGMADVVGTYKVAAYLDDQKIGEVSVTNRPRRRRIKIVVIRINPVPDVSAGVHQLKVVVDDGNAISEMDEDNNEAERNITVRELRARRRIRR